MSDVFISYSHKDSQYAHKLAAELEKRGFRVWIDERIDFGTQWPRVIQEQLDACHAFIVVMTPRSYDSDWVQNELSRAKRKRKPVFPLLLEGDAWLAIEATQYVDVRHAGLPAARFYDELSRFAARKHRRPDTLRHQPAAGQQPGGRTRAEAVDPKIAAKVEEIISACVIVGSLLDLKDEHFRDHDTLLVETLEMDDYDLEGILDWLEEEFPPRIPNEIVYIDPDVGFEGGLRLRTIRDFAAYLTGRAQ